MTHLDLEQSETQVLITGTMSAGVRLFQNIACVLGVLCQFQT
jgi:hypothetical protein